MCLSVTQLEFIFVISILSVCLSLEFIYLSCPFYYVNKHICACGESDSCLSNGIIETDCNCDSNLPIWASDDGMITAKDLLPITGVFYGPLLYESEHANFTIGRLRCSGKFDLSLNSLTIMIEF